LKSRNNEIGKFGIWVSILGAVFIGVYLHFDSKMQRVMKMCGFINSVMYLFGFIPQIELITKNKSTRGWSMITVLMIISNNILGICYACVAYIYQSKNEKSISFNLNWGSVIFNVFSILSNFIYLFQHKLYLDNKIHQNKYVVDIEEIKVAFL
jgi:uncharacterized protein with PQ loop repeat